MGKRKTVREKALSYSRVFPKEMQHLARLAYESGHRANRISAAERRVVEAAVSAVETGVGLGADHVALAHAVSDLQRAKGARHGR